MHNGGATGRHCQYYSKLGYLKGISLSSWAKLKQFKRTYVAFVLKHSVSILLLLLIVGVTSVVGAANAAVKGFDHFNTDFPLSGKHSNTACDACHLNEVFKGTPLKCSGCHNNKLALGKNAKHIAANDNCDNCHTTANFTKATVDHASVIGVCTACHQAPSGHFKTNAMCDDCHSSFAWTPAQFDHNSIDRKKCKDCHNKGPNHMKPSSKKCDDCHATDTWNIPFDHSVTSASCESCHLQDKRGNHYPTSDVCGNCHSPTKWSDAQFDHAKVGGKKCKDCHNKGPEHFEPSSDKCDDCHNSNNWDAKFDHTKITAVCETCHLKDKSVRHPDTSDACGSCHTPAKWADNSLDHNSVTECRSCHQNNVPKAQGHPSTSDECDACHSKQGKGWDFDHIESSKIYDCVFCHNGSIAAGKSKKHPKASDKCGACHSTIRWSEVSKFDHSGVNDCRSCHDKKQPRASSHPATAAECDLCHTNIGFSWVFAHSEASNNFDCVSCHNDKVAIGKKASHPKSPDKCVSCHSLRNWNPKPGAIDHSSFKTCNECHNYSDKSKPEFRPKHIKASTECIDCHTVKGVNWRFGNHKRAEALLSCKECHANDQDRIKHPNASPDCKVCHKSSPASWNDFVRPFPHAQTKSACNQCHHLLQENPTHFDTSGNCSECHISTAIWSTSGKPDHAVVSGKCVDCHNGSSATGKNPKRHIPSSEQCELCHTINNWGVPSSRATSNIDHTRLSRFCGTCHVTPPIPAQHFDIESIGCEECHGNTQRWELNAWYDHTQKFVNVRPHRQDCKLCHPTNSRVVSWDTTYRGTCASCHERDFSERAHKVDPNSGGGVPDYNGPLSADTEMWECNTSCHGTGKIHTSSKF